MRRSQSDGLGFSCSRAIQPFRREQLSALPHEQEADAPLLPVAEGVIDERKLAGDVAGQLEADAAAGADVPCLHAANRRPRRSAQVDRVELVADDVAAAWVRR